MIEHLPAKSRRFIACALKEKIERMKAERDELGEADKWQLDNDLTLYEALLKGAERQ